MWCSQKPCPRKAKSAYANKVFLFFESLGICPHVSEAPRSFYMNLISYNSLNV